MSAIVAVSNLEFSRNHRELFGGLSFSVQTGDMTALVGPNGVGKSTLLSVVSGLLAPKAGNVLVNGREIRRWNRRELSRTIALVPQILQVPFMFRVDEIVAQGRVPYLGRFGSLSNYDLEVVENAMHAVDVLPLRDRIFNELSGGEMQRVKIAVALAQQPKIMLLDEPTQHLDVGRQIEIARLLRRLNEGGITIIAAIHDLALVRDNFSTAVLLTPEPAHFAGSVQDVMRPDRLERAFGVDGSHFENTTTGWDHAAPQNDSGRNRSTIMN